MDDREVVLVKMEDPSNAVEFQDTTLAWEKARPPAAKPDPPPKKRGGMKRVLRREKLTLYISTEDSKGNKECPNAQSLLTNMEQDSPQSTISSTQSIRPPLHKTLHHIDLRIKRVTTQSHVIWIRPFWFKELDKLLSASCNSHNATVFSLRRVHWLESVEVSAAEKALFCLLYWDRWDSAECSTRLLSLSFLFR